MGFLSNLYRHNQPFFAALAGLGLLAGLLLLSQTQKGGELLAIAQHRNNLGDLIFPYITLLGEAYVYIAAGLWAWWLKRRRLSVFIGLLGCSAALLSWVSKSFFGQPRPKTFFADIQARPDLVSYVPEVEIASSYTSSFPSGHTLAAFAIYGFLSFLMVRQTHKLGLLLLAVSVGFSRMYLFQHFLSDVLAGAVFGTALAVGFYQQYQKPQPPLK